MIVLEGVVERCL